MRLKTPQQADKILTAAAELFGTQRFHEVRMEDIAAAAGVGKATLYRYFGDKEELYLALLARASDQFMRQMECVARGPGGPRRRLEQLADAILSYFDDHPHLLDLIQRSEVRSEESGAFPWQQTRENLPRLLKELFAEAAARGEFHVRDPDLNVLMLLGGLRAVIRFGDRPRPPRLGRAVVADFLSGVALADEPDASASEDPR